MFSNPISKSEITKESGAVWTGGLAQ